MYGGGALTRHGSRVSHHLAPQKGLEDAKAILGGSEPNDDGVRDDRCTCARIGIGGHDQMVILDWPLYHLLQGHFVISLFRIYAQTVNITVCLLMLLHT